MDIYTQLITKHIFPYLQW